MSSAPQKISNYRIGSSIKTYAANGKEEWLTVENYRGDIGLYRNGTLKAKRLLKNGDSFTYKNTLYIKEIA